MDILVPNISRNSIFGHLIYNFKTLGPQKISIFKLLFTLKITLISVIKKIPLTFLVLKSSVLTKYIMFVLLRPRRNDREQFQKKERRSIDFHAILTRRLFFI